MFKDFFGSIIKHGDWIHLPRSDNTWQMRFAQVEKVGSTGKLLVRTYLNIQGRGWQCYPSLVPVHQPGLVWKLDQTALPESLTKFISRGADTP